MTDEQFIFIRSQVRLHALGWLLMHIFTVRRFDSPTPLEDVKYPVKLKKRRQIALFSQLQVTIQVIGNLCF